MVNIKLKPKHLFGILAVAIILIIGGLYITGFFTKSGQYDNFAKCLTEKGVKMYGTYWCHACNQQKDMFGSSFKYVNYIECSQNQIACQGIQYTPTWEINGKMYIGLQQLKTLSDLTGCPLT